MNLYFFGHSYKYAAEQMLLTMFPQERPVYPDGEPTGDRGEISLSAGEAACRLIRQGQVFRGKAVVEPYGNDRERVRMEQRAVKLAFYRAALESGVSRPPWGALTGVKPGKLMAQYLKAGKGWEDFAADFDVSPDRARLCQRTAQAALDAKASLSPGDVGLYVGIPFCPTRCAYCSFISSAVGSSRGMIEPYLNALSGEIAQVGTEIRGAGLRPVALYFGGGTPTTLSPEQFDRLCGQVENAFDLSALREYTVEAGRPDTITAERLAVLKAHGVTRVSVNPQTMSDAVLETIGRRHTAQDVVDALALVRRAGDFQVNMDLIAGLPGDSVEGFRQSLDRVLALEPENVTVHTLAIKNGSRLAEHPQALPDGAAVGRMVDYAMERLTGAGYVPYYLYRQKYMSGGWENVGWARPGTENLYNILMMEELAPIYALGAGGSTKIPGPDGSIQRRMNPKYPKEYIERVGERALR
ncbi:MAG: coproporphyrinogen dehydrogenase HemZ [Oscillospiraceae bacterium]|nr:coproporphyrinogen dehydrogenase HemZ [Oscillospiraceae bacterium]